MKEYHKIQTVFLRDPETKHRMLLEGQFARPEFEYLKEAEWVFTEKVDGTNIRVDWCDELQEVLFGGRTANAQIPTFLFSKLQKLFPLTKFKELYQYVSMTLYGEGYGAKIQKGGGNYIPDGVDFILFDVMINGNWLSRENVRDIADKLKIKTVPVIATGSLSEGVELVKTRFKSMLRSTEPEGLVMRPKVELQDSYGRRIITKLKIKDFNKE